MSADAAPLSPAFRADLQALTRADLGAVGIAGSLHLGASPASAAGAPGGDVEEVRESPLDQIARTWELLATDADTVRAWAHVDRDSADRAAREAAAEIGSRGPRGWLHGVPVGVKDIIDVAGMPTRAGSDCLAGASNAEADAGVVGLLRRAGAVVVGKTRTHEFAFGGTTPPTRNPRDLDRIPGGSSGGSAAAVAAGHVRVALGTDTGGSVRIPSAYCGTVGMVPSPGLLPLDGVMPLAWSMDRIGIITSTVADLVGTTQALGLVSDVEAADWRGLRVGVPRGAFEGAVDPVVVERVQTMLAMAERSGAVVVEVEIPHQDLAVVAGLTLILAEGAEVQRGRRAEAGELFGSDVRGMLAAADQLDAASYVRAQRLRALLRCELIAVLGDVDVMAHPTMPNLAPRAADIADGQLEVCGTRIGIADAHLRYNIGANLAALPCATQPLPREDTELPVGLEWVAAPGRDDRLLAVMLAAERLWH